MQWVHQPSVLQEIHVIDVFAFNKKPRFHLYSYIRNIYQQLYLLILWNCPYFWRKTDTKINI